MKGIHKHDKDQNAEYVAVSDPWRVAREKRRDAVQGVVWPGREADGQLSRHLGFERRRTRCSLLSPDHHHSTHLEAAAKVKKHAYCEKPLARNMEELCRAVDAVKAAGIVVQIGTQIRSLPTSTACNELWKSGVLGKASRLEQCRNGERPYWYHYMKDIKKEDVDWNEFLGNAPKRPFAPDVYSGWYGYLDYTDGPIANLGCHYIDLYNYITGVQFPTSCVCNGGVFTWKDEHNFTCPDHVEALWVYPEELMVAYSSNFGNSAVAAGTATSARRAS